MCCLLPRFVNRQLPCLHANSHHALLQPQIHHRNPWFGNRHALAGQIGCVLLITPPLAMQKGLVQPVRSNLHAPTRNTRFCPPQRLLRMQANLRMVKYTPRRVHSRSFWPHALTLIWRNMSSMHSGTSTLERGVIGQRISCRTVEHVDKSAKHSFCITSRFHVESRQKYGHLHPPPLTHTFLKWTFLTDFKKYTHTPLPQGTDILAHRTKNSRTPGKIPKPAE